MCSPGTRSPMEMPQQPPPSAQVRLSLAQRDAANRLTGLGSQQTAGDGNEQSGGGSPSDRISPAVFQGSAFQSTLEQLAQIHSTQMAELSAQVGRLRTALAEGNKSPEQYGSRTLLVPVPSEPSQKTWLEPFPPDLRVLEAASRSIERQVSVQRVSEVVTPTGLHQFATVGSSDSHLAQSVKARPSTGSRVSVTSHSLRMALCMLHECWEGLEEVEMSEGASQLLQTTMDHLRRKPRRIPTFALRDVGLRSFLLLRFQQTVFLHPQSMKRCIWSYLGMLLIICDLFMLPLQVFSFDEEKSYRKAMDWLGSCFWTVDILLTCCTGVYSNDFLLITDLKRVAIHYLKTWLLFDLVLTGGSWLNVVMEAGDNDVVSSASSLRALHALRFLRVLRIIKLKTVLQGFEQKFSNSNMLVLGVSIFQRLFALIYINHVFACMWYTLGKSTSEGWVNEEKLAHPLVGDKRYLYLAALHWSLAQFTGNMDIYPNNSRERLYTLVVMVVALLLFSVLISSVTSTMVQLQVSYQERLQIMKTLRDFLRVHGIDPDLSMQVKDAITKRMREESDVKSHEKLLQLMPTRLLIRVQFEVRWPILVKNSIFKSLEQECPALVQRLCAKGIEDVLVQADDVVFSSGDKCSSMYFVSRGRFRHLDSRGSEEGPAPDAGSSGTKGAQTILFGNVWVCEATLWMQWRNTGDLSSIGSGSELFAVSAELFMEIVAREYWSELGMETRSYVLLYAHSFVAAAKQRGCSDIGLLAAAPGVQESACDHFLSAGGGGRRHSIQQVIKRTFPNWSARPSL